MYHKDVSKIFEKWFIDNNPGWLLFKNETGYASKEKVHYGIPNFGGGSDFFAFGFSKTRFYEIKTDAYPNLEEKQINFWKGMESHGFECFVFRSIGENFYLVRSKDYKPMKSFNQIKDSVVYCF